MAKIYNTKQKNEIFEVVKSSFSGHFTAEELCGALKEREQNVGVSTVYRHLDRLVKQGVLRKYSAEHGESACYQLVEASCSHFHLKCLNCGRLEHLSCGRLDAIGEHIRDEHGFLIDASKTVFYGLCKVCGNENT